MTDQITKLLDNVQRLDEQATQGPWTWGDNRDGLGNNLHPTVFPGKYSPIADFEYTNDEDAEFIALSRTALPKLASVITEILAFVEFAEKTHPENDEFDLAVRSCIQRIREAIKNGMEDTND